MKKQLQGISLLLFAIVLMMFSMIDPWVPIFEGITDLIPFIGLICGIIGLVFSFKKEE